MAQSICSIEDCDRPQYARGVCNLHYQRWRRGAPGAPSVVADRIEWPKVCAVEACTAEVISRGLCVRHYARLRKHGTTDLVTAPRQRPPREPCVIDGCNALRVGRGWCSKHWTRWKRHGSPTAQVRGEVVNGRRICAGCNAAVLIEDWYVTPAGRYVSCRECFGEWNRNRGHARRAVAEGERFDRREILNRDQWVCQLCAHPIDPTLQHPDPMSATLDHIIPIARGGEHSRANAQSAHRICNMRKWAHVPT